MAAVKEISKKRKRPSVPITRSLKGICTRSKSQLLLHRNRSNQSQPYFTRGGNRQDLQPFVKKRKNSSIAEDSPVGNDLSSVSIKDLRSRRVFSPSSTDGVIRNCLDDTENPGKSEVAGNCLDGSQEACGNGDFKKWDMSNEEFVQSTPPDAEISGAKQVDDRNRSDFLDQFLEKNPSENLQKNDDLMEKSFQEERNGMNYSIKSVLKPCSCLKKLFKTPGSISFRRLLPYLMETEKDCSCSPTMGHCRKTENGFEEKQLSASNSRAILVDKSKTSGCSLEGQNNDSNKALKAVSDESFTSQDNEEIRKFELQVSCQDQNLNCLKHASPTIEDSSSDNVLTDDGGFAKTNFESPGNAQNLEALDPKDRMLSLVSNTCESCDYDKVTQNSKSEIEEMPKGIIFHSFEAQHLNSLNPILSKMGGNSKCSLQRTFGNDGKVIEQVKDLKGGCTLMTPPDSDMSPKSETDDCRGNRGDHVIQKSTDETFHRKNGQGSDGRSLDLSPKNKLVPNPRLHQKLSKIPGSFSYRRLLPFLIDMTNDYSCASGSDQSLKVESSEEKPVSPFFTSGEETCMGTFNGKGCPVKHYKLTRHPSKQAADCPMIMDPQPEQGSIVEPTALDTNQKLEASPKNEVDSPTMSSSSLIHSGLLPREEGAKSVAYQLPLETEEDCIKSTEKCANQEKQIEADSFVKASNPPGILSAGLKKGILKRNPRGCRGVCTCLNCSSFRLHAERSFEFSRNQMQDAEEVALDLIKELSYLRNMLEKSAFGDKDQTSICINQVKEACKKACDAEELAKTRLGEMKYDLNIHYRIPSGEGPSVRFANYVEEQVIPVAD